MESQSYVAVAAAEDVFAGGAEDEIAVAAAIEEENGLLTSGEDFVEAGGERVADEGDAVVRDKIFQVDESHFGEGQVHNAFRETDHRIDIFSGEAIIKCF